MSKPQFLRSAVIGAAALAFVGSHAASAAPFASASGIVAAAQSDQSQLLEARHHRHRRGNRVAAGVAIGALGLIAGSALASNNYYGGYRGTYYEPYYSYGPPPVYYRRDYRPHYYPPPPRYYAPRPHYYPYYPPGY